MTALTMVCRYHGAALADACDVAPFFRYLGKNYWVEADLATPAWHLEISVPGLSTCVLTTA